MIFRKAWKKAEGQSARMRERERERELNKRLAFYKPLARFQYHGSREKGKRVLREGKAHTYTHIDTLRSKWARFGMLL